MPDIRFITLDPGHFHASLVQKEMYPGVSPTVHVFAPLGPDLMDHLGRIARFNLRQDAPTRWELEVHTGADFLERMLRDRPGTFAAGELLDWEAPTGGYLLTACLATGRLAGRAASDWLARHGAGESGREKAAPTGSVAFPTPSRSD